MSPTSSAAAAGRFHNPAHASDRLCLGIDTAFEDVRALVLRGLEPTQRAA